MMFGRILNTEECATLAELAAPIIVQQTYEVISDNLSIGLAQRAESDGTFDERRAVVSRFNQAVIARLSGHGAPLAEALAPVRAAAQRLSLFEQSHSPEKHRALCGRFAADLEHDVWPALVAGGNATAALADACAADAVGRIVHDGLVARYAGVEALVREPERDLIRRLQLGADTILVRPTLAFFAGLISEHIRPRPAFATVVAEGMLDAAVSDAALLVRLLNDVGTDILRESEDAFARRSESLQSMQRREGVRDSLLAVTLESSFTRIHKDLALHEFNVCLDLPPSADPLHAFTAALAQVREVYRQRMQTLVSKLAAIDAALEDTTISSLVMGFVLFHQKLYVHRHDDVRGEFAV
jgi:hypothetical protein